MYNFAERMEPSAVSRPREPNKQQSSTRELRWGADRPFAGVSRRRQPPYARRHAERLSDPLTSVWVAAGTGSWDWARERERSHVVIVCPVEKDPAGYDWTACAGHDPILLVQAGATDGKQVRALVEALMRDGSTRILTQEGTRYVAQEVADVA